MPGLRPPAQQRGVDIQLAERRFAAREMLHLSIVVPTKNEARSIGWLLEHLPPEVDEVILVDGQSTDGTVEAARRVRPDVTVVFEHRPGKGAAIRAGFAAARG